MPKYLNPEARIKLLNNLTRQDLFDLASEIVEQLQLPADRVLEIIRIMQMGPLE